jgi:hypothetical protein
VREAPVIISVTIKILTCRRCEIANIDVVEWIHWIARCNHVPKLVQIVKCIDTKSWQVGDGAIINTDDTVNLAVTVEIPVQLA